MLKWQVLWGISFYPCIGVFISFLWILILYQVMVVNLYDFSNYSCLIHELFCCMTSTVIIFVSPMLSPIALTCSIILYHHFKLLLILTFILQCILHLQIVSCISIGLDLLHKVLITHS